ncbi:MAG: YtxH domain-containing protein [Ferruginibacter sp.]
MTTSKLITGILAGAAVGAILGILFAPDKGASTRKKIARKSTDITDAIKNGFTTMTDAITNKYENIKEDTAEVLEKGKEKLQTEENKRNYQHAM